MSKAKVYIARINEKTAEEIKEKLFGKIIRKSNILDFLKPKEFAAVKLTFGEKNNRGFVGPRYLKKLIHEIRQKRAKPFLTDTNTLYKGERMNAIDHYNLAMEHGFGYERLGVPVIIGDGLLSRNYESIEINRKHFKEVKLASIVKDCDSIISVAHITGHLATGMGAALKNIGMGFANRAGKLNMHSCVKPRVLSEKCTLCRACMEICPVGAIKEKNGKAEIDPAVCIGCGDCLIACRFDAVEISFSDTAKNLQEKIVEYYYGVHKVIGGRMAFLNYVFNITKECDCWPGENPVIAPPVGFLASKDPVAIDQASCDLVLEAAGKDVFLEQHADIDWNEQLKYAESLGLGTRNYEFVEVTV